MQNPIFKSLPQSVSHSLFSPSLTIIVPKRRTARAIMPCTSLVESSDGNGAVRSFKLKESTFLAAQMPKKEIAADRFIEAHPEYDGRGVIIAIFDSGVDPAAAGLRVTSDGKPKVIDVIDCTGSGDVDTSTVVKADDNCCITGASGASLVINSSWKNPSGEWHVGCKLVYELFTDTLTSRVKKERKRRWDEKNQEAIAEAVKQLDQFDKKHTKVEGAHLKMVREDLQNRVDLLRKQADSYDDKGPVIDAVVWHDGELWRAALDTQSLEDESGCGKLADFVPLTNYRLEQKHGVFSKLDACTCVLNVYNEGNILSIVTDSSPHATHVAGIAAAFHPEEPLLNGVAPGAQIVSCKIGDSRLGSMETGTGLTRALIAAVEHKCDLINMSYGEPTLLPDYGRFVDLVNEVVNKHRLIFVSSAGNNGPALTTVGAPGGTSSSIIGVGAYVSPAMAAGAHLLVEPPTEGLEYTWSSRGPTVDGDLGVSISAPGGAVAPVPTWTLQRRMLMNGTSMSSPSACGGVALIVSAMKAEGIPVSPYTVRKALENTSIPIGALPEEKLTAGQGLMQVDKAYDYMQKVQNLPCVWYQVKIKQAGITSKPTSSATSRGIYLREPLYCHQSTEWTVEIAPKFHEDANNLDQLVPFEECIELHSTGEAVVRAPDYLLLTHNGRSFSIVVDPTNLSDGLHYYEVYGVDSKAPWRGPLFRIPVTITKPSIVTSRPPLISFQGISFVPGQIERRFIEVPFGATWVEATMRTYGFDTARRFFIDTVQLSPLQRPIKWESVATFSSPSSKNFVFRVEGGQTMELAIAQFWSSGIGSHETTIVDFEIAFRGIKISKEEVVLDGSEAPVRIDAEALLSTEKLVPSAVLNKIRVPYRPIDCKLHALSADRDKLPSGKQILALTLTYKFKLEDDAELKPQIPLLNNRIYDNKFESQFYMISDVNKRVHAEGDVYPDSSKLPKGEYTVQLYLRHDNVQYLEKMKQLVLFIERKLEEKDIVRLNFYSQPDGPLTGDGSFNSSDLVPGVKEAFYVGPPAKDKLPKNSREGSVLFGPISYEGGKGLQKNPASYQISYIVPPIKLDEDKGKSSSDTKSVSERLEEEVRDAKIKILSSLNQGTDEERAEWKKLSQSLKRRVKMNMNSISVLKLVLFIFWPWLVNSKGEQNRLLVNMTLVQNATALGAYCLDGSLPAYHLHRGFGAGVDNWLLQFEGGGWCNDIKSCLDRSKSNHGSTRYMNKWEVFSGILSNNASFNPDFYNWNRVKIRYCDGASFSGDAKFYNGTSLLYFRGQRIWQAIILDLLPKGLGHAKKAMLSGCSAGGLATFLHCDNFTSYLPNNASVKCLSDAGFFLDERDIALNHTMRSFYEGLITLQGVEPNLNLNCTSTLYYPHLCFFPQYALPFIETPFFILNSAYDVYQFHHILVPPSSDPRRHWDHCKLNVTACDTSQLNILQGFRIDMLTALRDFYQNSTRDGMYINSCFTHCQSETQDTWFAAGSPRIHNKTIAETVGDWYFSRNISKEIDCAYPCDTTCHHMI